MADTHLTNAEQDAFGHWLSGLTDGEGSFILLWNTTLNCASVRFSISLRADDLDILQQIQTYWGCGRIYARKARGSGKRCPQHDYTVSNIAGFQTLIAHFHRYPLRAKKRRDFVIWEKGVELQARINRRPKRHMRKKGGFFTTWTNSEKLHFRALIDAIRKQRQYEVTESISLPTLNLQEEETLFDSIAD